ncbi:MAG: hypothetical protein AB8F34_05620 [Akkermansiaceae bacterium]
MSDKKKEMFERSLTLNDKKSVQAFRVIASRAELCDDGPPTALGQGVYTDAHIYKKGKGTRTMGYFAVLESEHRARMMEQIPRTIKIGVGDGKARLNLSPLRSSIAKLAHNISSYDSTFAKLQNAYTQRAPIPREDLLDLLKLPPIDKYKSSELSSEQKKNLSNETSKILKAILSNGSWKALTGKGDDPQGLLLKIMRIQATHYDSLGMIPFAIDLKNNHMPAALLSEEGERFLLEFITNGYYTPSHDRIIDACKLTIDPLGRLAITKRLDGMNYHRKIDFSFLENNTIKQRLKYLNNGGIIDTLLPRVDKSNKAPARMLQIQAITMSGGNPPLAKVSFYDSSKLMILAMHKKDEAWVCGGVWGHEDYHRHKNDDPFGEEYFRKPDEAPPNNKEGE